MLRDIGLSFEAPLLVYANKQDKPVALTDREIEQRLGLKTINTRYKTKHTHTHKSTNLKT